MMPIEFGDKRPGHWQQKNQCMRPIIALHSLSHGIAVVCTSNLLAPQDTEYAFASKGSGHSVEIPTQCRQPAQHRPLT
jgi:hypothetical protein